MQVCQEQPSLLPRFLQLIQADCVSNHVLSHGHVLALPRHGLYAPEAFWNSMNVKGCDSAATGQQKHTVTPPSARTLSDGEKSHDLHDNSSLDQQRQRRFKYSQ